MKTLLLGTTAYRIVQRRKNSVSLQPMGTSNPSSFIFRMPGEDRWSHVIGRSAPGERRTPIWYRQTSPDTFVRIK